MYIQSYCRIKLKRLNNVIHTPFTHNTYPLKECSIPLFNNSNNGEHLYSAFPHSSKRFDTHYYPDRPYINMEPSQLPGKYQSSCLLGNQRLAN